MYNWVTFDSSECALYTHKSYSVVVIEVTCCQRQVQPPIWKAHMSVLTKSKVTRYKKNMKLNITPFYHIGTCTKKYIQKFGTYEQNFICTGS